MFNATFINITVISWWSVLFHEGNRSARKKNTDLPNLLHNVVSCTPCLSGIRAHNVRGDWHRSRQRK
jgi:hypothetical protein